MNSEKVSDVAFLPLDEKYFYFRLKSNRFYGIIGKVMADSPLIIKSKAFAFDVVQRSALMICRNKLRMIYEPPCVICMQKSTP